MLTQLGIALIVVGTILPIIMFFIARKIRAHIKKKIKGEKFDKQGHSRMEVLEEGKDIGIPVSS